MVSPFSFLSVMILCLSSHPWKIAFARILHPLVASSTAPTIVIPPSSLVEECCDPSHVLPCHTCIHVHALGGATRTPMARALGSKPPLQQFFGPVSNEGSAPRRVGIHIRETPTRGRCLLAFRRDATHRFVRICARGVAGDVLEACCASQSDRMGMGSAESAVLDG